MKRQFHFQHLFSILLLTSRTIYAVCDWLKMFCWPSNAIFNETFFYTTDIRRKYLFVCSRYKIENFFYPTLFLMNIGYIEQEKKRNRMKIGNVMSSLNKNWILDHKLIESLTNLKLTVSNLMTKTTHSNQISTL